MKKIPYAQQMAKWRKRRELVKALDAKGLSLAQIGRRLGCTKQRVHQLLAKA